jgi:hypothetical protein
MRIQFDQHLKHEDEVENEVGEFDGLFLLLCDRVPISGKEASV